MSVQADIVGDAFFDKLVKSHPELCSFVINDSLQQASDNENGGKAEHDALHSSSQGDQRQICGCLFRGAVAFMNASCCGIQHGSEPPYRRECYCFCISRRPGIQVLPFLPDAFAAALYSRYRAIIFPEMSNKKEPLDMMLSASSKSDNGIRRIVGGSASAAVRMAQIRAENILLESPMKRGCVRAWHLRRAVLHIWFSQVFNDLRPILH